MKSDFLSIDNMLKVAYICEPQIGGTFSFFLRMRPKLRECGIDFRCIPPLNGGLLKGSRFESVEGVEPVSFPENNLPRASEILIQHLVDNRYDVLIVLPGSDVVGVNLVRYIPRNIRTVARVPMITRGAYAPTKAIDSNLDLVFAVSHRVAEDLVRRYGVSKDKIIIVYNGVNPRPINNKRNYGQGGRTYNLLYSGRLSDLDKGVMLLPRILKKVLDSGVDAKLSILGSGPDRVMLEKEFQRLGILNAVQMIGDVSLEKVNDFLAETDCYLQPSRFEGCPNALIEAMASGCACVASRIRGSIDQIVEEEHSGLLAEVADTDAFAHHVVTLARDPARCRAMGDSARQRIHDFYTASHTADAYAKALRNLMAAQDIRVPATSIGSYNVPRAMCPTWRTRVPLPVKNYLRKWLERCGVST